MIERSAGILVILLIVGCGSTPPMLPDADAPSSFTLYVDSLLDQPQFGNSFWGVKVVDLETGISLFERNARKSFVPASNMKLFTTATGLDRLGVDFFWTTTFLADGSLRADTLDGNLIVVGSGDPSIGGPLSDGDITGVFRAWADSLRAAGIRHVTGDIIGDDDAFDDTALGPGWMWDDESDWYSAEIGALTFNDNCVDVTVTGLAVDDTAEVTWEPLQTGYVSILNQTATLHPDSTTDSSYRRRRASNVIEVNTKQPAGKSTTRSITVTNPTIYFVHVLKEVLQTEGISVGGEPVDVDELFHKPVYSDAGIRRIAVHVSPPLSEIVATINKPSHNLQAELLLKSLGREVGGMAPRSSNAMRAKRGGASEVGSRELAGTSAGGASVVVEFLAAAGVDTSGVVVADGSGLSRYNLITPQSTVDLLTYMWTHPDTAVSGAYVRSLPVGGVDGTLESLIAEGPAVGNLRAKTGTMTGARSLSGYITTSSGRPLVFSLISNHHTVPTSVVNEVQRRLADLLARL